MLISQTVTYQTLPIISILAYIFAPITVFFCLKSIHFFLTPKKGMRFTFLRIVGTFALSGMVIYIGDLINFIPTLILFIIAVCLSYENSFWQNLAVSFMTASLGLSFSALIHESISIELWSVLKFFFWLLLFIFIRKYGPEPGYHLSDSLWKLLLCLSLTPFGIVAAIVLGLPLSVESGSSDTILFYEASVKPVIMLLLLLALFSFFSLLSSVKVLSRQYQMEQDQVLNEMNQQYYHNLEQQQFEIRKLRHDMVHHLQAVTLLKDEARTDYLNNLLEHPSLKYGTVFCANQIVNAVINAKMTSIRKLDIDFHCKISIPEEIPMEKIDLCAIFANCLDNATEACEKLSPLMRTISLEARFEKGIFLLRCANPMPDTLLTERGRIITSKHDRKIHGIGIPSIREVTGRHHGTLDLSAADGEFILLINIIL